MNEELKNTKRILQELKMEIEELNKQIPGEVFGSTGVTLDFKAKFEERINKMTMIYQTLEDRVEEDFTKLKEQYNQVKLTQQNTDRKDDIRNRMQRQEERIHERIRKLDLRRRSKTTLQYTVSIQDIRSIHQMKNFIMCVDVVAA